MQLWRSDPDGSLTRADPLEFSNYAAAALAAKRNFHDWTPRTSCLLLFSDGGGKVMRTYSCDRDGNVFESLRDDRFPKRPSAHGVWADCPPMFPAAELPLTDRERELKAADLAGYERGFAVGLKHRREYLRAVGDFARAEVRVAAWLAGQPLPPWGGWQEHGLVYDY